MRIGVAAILSTIGGPRSNALTIIDELSRTDRKHSYHLFADTFEGVELPHVDKVLVRMPVKAYQPVWDHFSLPAKVRLKGMDLLHHTKNAVPIFKPCKTVVTIYDLAHIVYPDTFNPLQRRYLDFAIRYAARHADRIITDSQSTKRDLMRFLQVPAERISIVHLNCPKEIGVVRDPRELARVRRLYRLPDRYIISVGTLQPRKNVHGLIKAYSLLKRSRPSLPQKLVFVGRKGWVYDDLQVQVDSLGLSQDVIFTGSVPTRDLSSLYSLADLSVFPSFYEGFGIVALEAMACHTPLVASNVSSIPEVAGDAAVLVDPHKVDEIADAMGLVLDDASLRRQMVRRGIGRVEMFTIEKSARQTLQVYEEVMGGSVRTS